MPSSSQRVCWLRRRVQTSTATSTSPRLRLRRNVNSTPASSLAVFSFRRSHTSPIWVPFQLKLDPAIKGTINVLTAAKAVGVRRVVVTSSVSAITQKELWYPLSKTLAEKAAWDFSRESGLDVVVVNPGTVMGLVIPPTINASMVMLVRLLQGCTKTYENFFMGSIHFKDVALAHILVYENPSAF